MVTLIFPRIKILFIIIKSLIHQEVITPLKCMYSIMTSKFMKQKLIKLKEEIVKPTLCTPASVPERTSQQNLVRMCKI